MPGASGHRRSLARQRGTKISRFRPETTLQLHFRRRLGYVLGRRMVCGFGLDVAVHRAFSILLSWTVGPGLVAQIPSRDKDIG